MPSFDFEVTEYPKGNTPTSPGVPIFPFSVSKKRLITLTVRSLLTTRSQWMVRKYLAASMLPSFDFFVDTRHAPDFKLRMAWASQLRDFSITGRVGEFAQGICFAYYALQRRAFVCDFNAWSAANYSTVVLPRKTPDYAVYDPTAHYVLAVEAKGTRSDSHIDRMRRALKQAKAVGGHPGVTRADGCVVAFDAYQGGNASIHIQDPEFEHQASEEAMHDVFRRSFVSWYELTGEEEKAFECSTGMDASNLHDALDNMDPEDRERHEFLSATLLRDQLTTALGFHAGADFVIDPVVEEAIFSFDAFREGQWREVAGRDITQDGDDGLINFPDGTAIIPS